MRAGGSYRDEGGLKEIGQCGAMLISFRQPLRRKFQLAVGKPDDKAAD
jgi:hypothetical protein